jgi:superfamily I DNA/RNA helicase
MRGLTILIACPGAGKTRIVGARTALLSAELERTNWAGVAAITFTKSAADEIRNVHSKIAGRDIRSPHYIGTLDSFLYRYIFNPFAHLVLGKPDRPAELVPPNSNRLNNLFRGYKYAALHGISKEKYTYRATGEIRPSSSKLELATAVRVMKEEMWNRNISTIQDAAYFTLLALRAKPRLRILLARRFPFIMIDEVQDCSDVQMAIVDELVSGGHQELMLVGDPFQAIYQFREAEPKLLLEKAKDKKWNAVTLPDTHRCRPQIVKLINATVCNTDPSRRYLRSAYTDFEGAVRIVEANEPRAIAEVFIEHCNEAGLIPSASESAIIYAAHSSKMSREKVQRNDIEKLFQSARRELHVAFPLAKQQMLLGRNADALNEAIELFCWLLHNQSSYEATRQKLDTEFLKTLTPKIWSFCKNLPDTGLPLSEWIVQTNTMLNHFLHELGMKESFEIQLSRQVGAKKAAPLRSLLVGDGDYATDLPLTVVNVHQVKGRTFKAVLVYLEHGSQKMLSGNNLIKLLSGTKPFDKMTEKDRCIYVAITRAERLLCFCWRCS